MDIAYLAKRLSLDGKKAIVTGASGGIGAAIAKSLARFGAEVAVLGRNEEKIRETEREILAFGGKCDTWKFDVSDPEKSEVFLMITSGSMARRTFSLPMQAPRYSSIPSTPRMKKWKS